MEVTSSTEVTPLPTPHIGPNSTADGQNIPDNEKLDTETLNPPSSKAALGGDSTNDVRDVPPPLPARPLTPTPQDMETASTTSTKSKRRSGWFGGARKNRSESKDSTTQSIDTGKASGDSGHSLRDEEEEDHHDKWRSGQGERERHGREAGGWGVGEDAAMGLS